MKFLRKFAAKPSSTPSAIATTPATPAIDLVVSEILQAEQLPYYLFLADDGNLLNISHAVDLGTCQCR